MNDNPLNFSNLSQTWTKKSSLELGNYDAYPELVSNSAYNKSFKGSFNTTENYASYQSYGDNKKPYSLQNSVYSFKPMNRIQNIKPQKESFNNYDNLKNTWTAQKYFNL
jgi:hypothetical protein